MRTVKKYFSDFKEIIWSEEEDLVWGKITLGILLIAFIAFVLTH